MKDLLAPIRAGDRVRAAASRGNRPTISAETCLCASPRFETAARHAPNKDPSMKTRTAIVLSLTFVLALSGCQSPQQSMNSAYATCNRTGLRPGSWEYQNCTQSIYNENRQKSDQAAAAVAVGVAAGAIGAYAISEASKKKKEKDWDRDYPHRPRRYYDDYSYRPAYPGDRTRPTW